MPAREERRFPHVDTNQCAMISAGLNLLKMRKIKVVAFVAIAASLSTPTFADSEYDAYAMLVGLTAYPSICKKPAREKELRAAMNAEAKRLGFDITDPENGVLIALSSARFVGTSTEVRKTDPAKVARYCAEAEKIIAALLASHGR
jgi:hypothetical protein